MNNIVQGGVHLDSISMVVSTKKRLKEIVRDGAELLIFYSTSPMGPQFNGRITELDENTTLLVVGPDPDTSRKWYANITHNEKGFKVT